MSTTPRKRLSRQEQQQRTRAQLLAAAAEVFAGRGFTAATLDEISERAGYSRTAVYKHFANKDELFIAIMETRGEASMAALEAMAGPGPADAAQLAILGDQIAAEIANTTRWIVACFEFMAHVREVPELRERALRAQRESDQQTAGFLAHVCRSLDIEPPMPPEQLAVTLWAVANGLAIRAMVEDDLDVGRLFADAFNTIVTGGAVGGAAAKSRPQSRKKPTPDQ